MRANGKSPVCFVFAEVPGPIAGEPVITDSGRSCVTLSWPKPLHSGDAPVLAYRIEAWRLGSEGGARWNEVSVGVGGAATATTDSSFFSLPTI